MQQFSWTLKIHQMFSSFLADLRFYVHILHIFLKSKQLKNTFTYLDKTTVVHSAYVNKKGLIAVQHDNDAQTVGHSFLEKCRKA